LLQASVGAVQPISSNIDTGLMHCHMVQFVGNKISLCIRMYRTAGILPNLESVRRRCGSCGSWCWTNYVCKCICDGKQQLWLSERCISWRSAWDRTHGPAGHCHSPVTELTPAT